MISARGYFRHLPDITSFTLLAPAGIAVICVRASRGPT
jgi:hypothetical protein